MTYLLIFAPFSLPDMKELQKRAKPTLTRHDTIKMHIVTSVVLSMNGITHI